MRTLAPRLLGPALCLALALSGCTGSIQGESPPDDSTSPGTSSTDGGGANNGATSSNNASTNNGTTSASNNGTTSANNGTTSANNGGTSTNSGTTSTNSGTTTPPACATEAMPLRRMSHFEYRNTLADLFPDLDLPNLDLPEDDRPHEFDNDAEGMSPSTVLIERYLEIGRAIAERVGPEQLRQWADCAPADDSFEEYDRCGRAFVRTQGTRLFRRPITDEQVDHYSALFTADIPNATFDDRLVLTLQALLASPEFLYRFEGPSDGQQLAPGQSAPLDAYALASRLSYFLWGTTPDADLLAAAADGSLLQPDTYRQHAQRLADHDRARAVFNHFHAQWLDFEHIYGVTKVAEDNLDNTLRDAMYDQAEVFVDQVLFNEYGTLADLLTSDRTFYNQALAPIYGVEPPAEGWAEAPMPNRAGLLTQPFFLASHGHPDKPSPVLRGAFVLDRIMCIELGAPPPNAEAEGAALADELEGPLTNRQVYELITSESPCDSCHETINPVGAAFEVYDTMGRHRTQEPNGLTVDASAEVAGLAFEDAVDFVQQLAQTEAVEACVVKKWVRYANAGGPAENSRCFIDNLRDQYRANGGSLRDLQLAIATHPSFAVYTEPAEPADEEATP